MGMNDRLSGVRPSARWAQLVGMVLPLAMLWAGCAPLVIGAAGGVAGAVYVMGKLKDEVSFDVPTVHRALLDGMKDLGLTPTEDKVDKLSAHTEAAFADGEHVWINLDAGPDTKTTVVIRVGMTGNERRARAIHDAMRQHLPTSQKVSEMVRFRPS